MGVYRHNSCAMLCWVFTSPALHHVNAITTETPEVPFCSTIQTIVGKNEIWIQLLKTSFSVCPQASSPCFNGCWSKKWVHCTVVLWVWNKDTCTWAWVVVINVNPEKVKVELGKKKACYGIIWYQNGYCYVDLVKKLIELSEITWTPLRKWK